MDWFAKVITGDQHLIDWYGPFPDKETARAFCLAKYASGRVEIPDGEVWYHRTKKVNEEIAFIYRCWYGEGREKPEGGRRYVFTGPSFEVFARDLGGLYQITDDETERARIEEDEETGEYCSGPMIDDWCEPCEGMEELASTFYAEGWDTGSFFPIGPEGVEFIEFGTGPTPYLYRTLVASTQEEVDATIAAFSSDYDNVWSSDGSNTLFAAFGWGRVARVAYESGGFGIQTGYPDTNFGALWYCPDDAVEAWIAGGCFCNFQAYENQDYPTFDPILGDFTESAIYLLGYQVRVELFAQVISGGHQYGTCFTARTNYDLAYFNQIIDFPGYQTFVFRNTLYSDFIPAGDGIYFGKNWYEQPGVSTTLPVGFRHTNDLDGKVIDDMVGPWALAVNCQITPIFVAANRYDTCDILIEGTTQATTVIGRCPRESFQTPFPYSGIGESTNPNFPPWPFTYGIFREGADSPNLPVPKYKQELWGWSGNGIDFATLLILNPAWAVNAFIDNWPPFKRVPGYRSMVKFIRFITGKRAQYESIGTDPATGWEVYPVPVIVGADGSGFPVYGEPVYRQVQVGGENL